MSQSQEQTIALALTWDGARWPVGKLPPKARAFLGGDGAKVDSLVIASKLFSEDQVREIRVCWVPKLKGGADVLANPFEAARRVKYRVVRSVQMGDVLGVIYRK